MLPISVHHHLVGAFLHLTLDESQQMLLIHTRRVVNVSIYLSDVIEVSMRHPFTVCHLFILIQEHIEVEFAF